MCLFPKPCVLRIVNSVAIDSSSQYLVMDLHHNMIWLTLLAIVGIIATWFCLSSLKNYGPCCIFDDVYCCECRNIQEIIFPMLNLNNRLHIYFVSNFDHWILFSTVGLLWLFLALLGFLVVMLFSSSVSSTDLLLLWLVIYSFEIFHRRTQMMNCIWGSASDTKQCA